MKLEGKTNEKLVAMADEITSDIKNLMPRGNLFLFTEAARKKLDKINRAIANNVKDMRIARGEKINNEGYSGRQSRRRR